MPRDFRTVQGAIDAADDGDTIRLAPGVYQEALEITGKRLRIIGSRRGRSEISRAGRDAGLVTYARGGGGELRHLVLRGGAYAVGGIRDGTLLPSSLVLRKVSISEGYRGIVGAFSDLHVTDVSVFGTAWHGISLTHLSGKATLFDIEVHDAGGVGLLILNGGPGDITVGGHYHHNALGGVQIQGHVGTVNLVFIAVDHNGHSGVVGFGVALFDATAGMVLGLVTDHHQPTSTGCQGVGVWAINSSSITITGTQFWDNCLGVETDGSVMALGSDVFTNVALPDPDGIAGFDFNGTPFSLVDLGGNVCGFHVGQPDESLIACQNSAMGVSPPNPLDP